MSLEGLSEAAAFLRVLRDSEPRTNGSLERQFHDVTAEISTPIITACVKESLSFLQSKAGQFL